jgi:hypothetical protein
MRIQVFDLAGLAPVGLQVDEPVGAERLLALVH